jgi:hypothetical protein
MKGIIKQNISYKGIEAPDVLNLSKPQKSPVRHWLTSGGCFFFLGGGSKSYRLTEQQLRGSHGATAQLHAMLGREGW